MTTAMSSSVVAVVVHGDRRLAGALGAAGLAGCIGAQVVDQDGRIEDAVTGVEDREVEAVCAGCDRRLRLEHRRRAVVLHTGVDLDPVGVEERAVDADDVAGEVEGEVGRSP